MNINISPGFDLPGDALYGERAPGPGSGRCEKLHNKVNIKIYKCAGAQLEELTSME